MGSLKDCILCHSVGSPGCHLQTEEGIIEARCPAPGVPAWELAKAPAAGAQHTSAVAGGAQPVQDWSRP